jgi:hypothetical protein
VEWPGIGLRRGVELAKHCPCDGVWKEAALHLRQGVFAEVSASRCTLKALEEREPRVKVWFWLYRSVCVVSSESNLTRFAKAWNSYCTEPVSMEDAIKSMFKIRMFDQEESGSIKTKSDILVPIIQRSKVSSLFKGFNFWWGLPCRASSNSWTTRCSPPGWTGTTSSGRPAARFRTSPYRCSLQLSFQDVVTFLMLDIRVSSNLCQGSVYRPKRCVPRTEYGSFSLKRRTNILSQREDDQEEAKP